MAETQVGFMPLNGLKIKVRVLDRKIKGRHPKLLVAPVEGEGRCWVDAKQVWEVRAEGGSDTPFKVLK